MITKVNDIDIKIPDTSGFVTNTKCDSDKQGLEKKIEDADKKNVDKTMTKTKLIKKTAYNTNVREIKHKIPSAADLVTAAACDIKAIEIENKIPDVANLATKATLNTKAT